MSPPAQSVPIARLPRKAKGVVVHHQADAATAERLAALGLPVGAAFTVVASGTRPTVRVGESRIGLGPEYASAVHALRR
jgi:Fe2+ transport system protein FeoA